MGQMDKTEFEVVYAVDYKFEFEWEKAIDEYVWEPINPLDSQTMSRAYDYHAGLTVWVYLDMFEGETLLDFQKMKVGIYKIQMISPPSGKKAPRKEVKALGY